MAARGEDTPAQRVEARSTVVSFMAALVLWCLSSFAIDPGPIAKSENRYLASLPAYDAGQGGLSSYVPALDDYLSDHVALRDAMISLHARVKVGWFGASPSEKLIVGKEGWFYLNDESAVAQYRGLGLLSDEQLETWKRVLEQRRDWLAERGAAFIVVLVPNKHQIYPEFMPDRITRLGSDEQHAQLARYLAAHSDLHVVDLMPALAAARQVERVFHKTDTHWNDAGAYVGYREILAATAEALPEFAEVLRPTPVERVHSVEKGIGLVSMVGLNTVYREEVVALEKVDPQAQILMRDERQYERFAREQKPLALGVPSGGLPRAVVYRDSFANALIPYLSENFRRVLFVWNRDVKARYVVREQPDIVIQEIAGRLLDRIPEPISSE